MNMGQMDIRAMGGTQIIVGLSAIIKVVPEAYTYAENIKIKAGSGTLEIVSKPIALTGSSAAGWGLGYPIGTSEVISIGGPAVYYLAATGATMTLAVLNGYTSGSTFSI